MKSKIRSFLLLFIILFICFLYLEKFFPIAYLKKVYSENSKIEKPQTLKKIDLIYHPITEYDGNSLITLKDLINNLNKNQYLFLTEKNPLFFEGNYKDRFIYVKNIPCKEIFSVKEESSGILSFFKKFKYYIFYPFNKEYAFYKKSEIIDKLQFFKKFNPITEQCFIAKSDSYISLKTTNFEYPSLKYQLKLIGNAVYVKKDFDKLSFFKKKIEIAESIKNGSSYTYFYENPDFDFYAVEGKKELTLGSPLKLENNPIIYVYKPTGNYIIAVYKNGKVYKYYNSSFSIKPKTAGYYFFIVYKYDFNLKNIYFSFEPVIITNSFYVQ